MSENTNFSFKCKNQKSTAKFSAKLSESTTLQKKFDSDCHYCRKYDHCEVKCLKKKSDASTEKLLISNSATDSNQILNLTTTHEFKKGSVKLKKKKKTSAADEKRL